MLLAEEKISYDYTLDQFYDIRCFPNQDLMLKTISFLEMKKRKFDVQGFLNILFYQLYSLKQYEIKAYSGLLHLRKLKISNKRRHTLYALIILWKGQKESFQSDTILELIKKEFLKTQIDTPEKELCEVILNTRSEISAVDARYHDINLVLSKPKSKNQGVRSSSPNPKSLTLVNLKSDLTTVDQLLSVSDYSEFIENTIKNHDEPWAYYFESLSDLDKFVTALNNYFTKGDSGFAQGSIRLKRGSMTKMGKVLNPIYSHCGRKNTLIRDKGFFEVVRVLDSFVNKTDCGISKMM